LPKLVHAKLIETFEKADLLGTVGRPAEGFTPSHQLLIEIRNFKMTTSPLLRAEVELVARLLDKDGRIAQARTFASAAPSEGLDPTAVVAAFDEAFGRVSADLVVWTAKHL